MTQHYAKTSSNSCASSLGEAKFNSEVYFVNTENHTEYSSRKQNQNINNNEPSLATDYKERQMSDAWQSHEWATFEVLFSNNHFVGSEKAGSGIDHISLVFCRGQDQLWAEGASWDQIT